MTSVTPVPWCMPTAVVRTRHNVGPVCFGLVSIANSGTSCMRAALSLWVGPSWPARIAVGVAAIFPGLVRPGRASGPRVSGSFPKGREIVSLFPRLVPTGTP